MFRFVFKAIIFTLILDFCMKTVNVISYEHNIIFHLKLSL